MSNGAMSDHSRKASWGYRPPMLAVSATGTSGTSDNSDATMPPELWPSTDSEPGAERTASTAGRAQAQRVVPCATQCCSAPRKQWTRRGCQEVAPALQCLCSTRHLAWSLPRLLNDSQTHLVGVATSTAPTTSRIGKVGKNAGHLHLGMQPNTMSSSFTIPMALADYEVWDSVTQQWKWVAAGASCSSSTA